MNQNQESVLFKTSAATDVQCSGGVLTIAGLSGTKKSRISSILQVKSKAEVVQVVTVGATSYTPTGSTKYGVLIGDTNRIRNGAAELLKPYYYVTPPDITTLGATAALQREAISVALVAAINADTKNFVTATTSGGGNGFTITDAAGYYPVFSQTGTGRLGASQVAVIQNPDDSGYLATNVSITTAAVYSSGIGANLALTPPVVDALYGGLLSGYLIGTLNGFSYTTKSTTAALNGLPAVSGQNYDIFVITSLTDAPAHNQRGQLALVPKVQAIAVDNGTGTSTTNLTGFLAFEREMLRHVASVYANDPATQVDFFDAALVASATYPTTGAAVSTTDNVVMAAASGDNTWYINPIGIHTLLTPIVSTSGLSPMLDVTTQEGIELSVPNLTQCPKQFVVGKTEASFYGRINIGAAINATSFKSLSFGFRKKAAYAVDQTAYEAASVATACLGVPLDTGVAPVINIITGPGSAGALTNTSTAVTPTASQILDFLVTVDINGVARFYVNGVDKTPLLAATYTFTAALNLMPFISFRHGAAADAAPFVVQTMFVPAIWRA